MHPRNSKNQENCYQNFEKNYWAHFGPKRAKKLTEIIINSLFVTFHAKIRKFYRFNCEKLAKNPILGPILDPLWPKTDQKINQNINKPFTT